MAFTNASNFTMGDAQFNTIANQTNINQPTSFDNPDPLRMLLNHSAINAMADSPAVSYEPTCHPGTRKVVTSHIMAWARDPKADPILWLSGPAGAGKSCIQRTMVQSCIAEGLFLACFFFSVKQPETNTQTRFIATLAAQLAENIPGVRWYIKRAIKMDSRILTKALESQVEGLIFGPLQELDGSISNRLKKLFWGIVMTLGAYRVDSDEPWTKANVVVIDGLDECVNEKEQAHILRVIHSLATNPHFPFRFAIASRPEYAIRTAFSSSPLSNDTITLRLEDYEADDDLRRFLKAQFSRLKLDHPASKSIPTGWPSPEDEAALVTKASRQFVYVSVVMKHLANPRRNPMLELQYILGHRPSANDIKSNPFAELDVLYNRILHPPDIETSLLKSILHSIMHDKPGGRMFTVEDLDTLYGLAPGTTSSTLVDLHSVLKFSLPQLRPTFYHKSFEDFLISHSRAGDLYQSADQTHVQLTLAYYELGRQRQAGVAVTSRNVWDLSQLTISHACSVSDWSLFEREFTRDTLPAFIDSVIQYHITTPYGADIEAREGYSLRLNSYSRRYHSFCCTFEDGCLPLCRQLTSLSVMNTYAYGEPPDATEWSNVGLAPPAMVDTSSKAGCGCTESVDA